jgi:hypothetical protein
MFVAKPTQGVGICDLTCFVETTRSTGFLVFNVVVVFCSNVRIHVFATALLYYFHVPLFMLGQMHPAAVPRVNIAMLSRCSD